MEQYRGRPVIWQTEENNSRGTVSRSACHLVDRGKQQSWNSIEVGLSSGRHRKTTVVEQYRGRPVIWQTEENNSGGTVSRSACHLADRGKQQSVEQYRGRPVIWQTEENNSRGTVSRSACHLADRGKQQSWNSIEVGLSSGRQRKTTVVKQYRGRPVIWKKKENNSRGTVSRSTVVFLCLPDDRPTSILFHDWRFPMSAR